MIGTRGVPARYGGFETAVEHVGTSLVEAGHHVTVYCRNPGQTLTRYHGMRLRNLPAIRRSSLETLSHSGISTAYAVFRDRPDAAFVFNAANAPYVPILTRTGIPTAVHIDGLDWKRAKWQGAGSRYYKWAERRAVRSATSVVADAVAIQEYLANRYGRDSVMIPYGAPITHASADAIAPLGLSSGSYHLVVARIEPENHVREILHGFLASPASLPLVVVGSAPYEGPYQREVAAIAQESPRIQLLGSVWDQELLDSLYGNCQTYVHGHSVGGTNPSLLRAMGAGAPVVAFDCDFNREVTAGTAMLFAGPADLTDILVQSESSTAEFERLGEQGRAHVAEHYRWDDVCLAYLRLAEQLTGLRTPDKATGA